MKTGEKIFLIVFVLAGIAIAGAGYYLFIWEGDGGPDPVIPVVDKEPDPGLVAGEGEKEVPQIITDIEGDFGELEEDYVPEKDGGEDLGTLTGLVLSQDKKPISKAAVSIYRSRTRGKFIFHKNQKPLHAVKTDERGLFTIEPLYPGRGYRLVVDHDEYAREILENLHVKANEETKLPDILLTSGLTVFGTVRNDKGRPIGGARITILNTSFNPDDPLERFTTQRIARTDEEGKYTIAHINDSLNDITFLVRAEAAEHETQLVRNQPTFEPRSRIEYNFALAKAMRMKGQVVDQDLKPVAEAMINAVQLKAKERTNNWARTDKEGRFTLEGLSNADYYVTASHESFSPKAIKKAAAGSEDLYLVLEPRSGIAGQVTDARGNPVPVFWINVNRTSPSEHAETTRSSRKRFSHPEGRFIYENLDPGKYELEIMAKDFAPFRSETIKVERELYASGLVFKLSRGGSVSGTVLSPDGEPLRGVYVNLRVNKYIPNPLESFFGVADGIRTGQVKTNAEGFFKIDHIAPGKYQLEFGHRDYPRHRLNDVEVQGEQLTQVQPQYMKVGAVLQGRVYNNANVPLPSAMVTIIKTDNSVNITVTSDNEGFYKIPDLTPGKYTLSWLAKLKKDENPLAKISSLMQNTMKDLELSEGEVRNINLIANN